MKKANVTLWLIILLLFVATLSWAQTKIWYEHIQTGNINIRGAPIVVAQLDCDIPTMGGQVLVQFNGMAFPDVGDRIVLAASNDGNWYPNDGNTSFEIINDDLNARSFSHTRMYSVGGGVQSFYAVAQNYVETDGDGMASIYGTLTVKFFPANTETPHVAHQGISQTDINVRGGDVVVGQVDINASHGGHVIVRFDGICYADLGDLIVLAASNDQSWHVNDGNVSVESFDGDINYGPFCHTRVYPVSPGNNTFYAVAQNYVEMDGDGITSIYASLSAEYYPEVAGQPIVAYQGIAETNINLRGSAVVVGQQNVNPSASGKTWVHFDGQCYVDVGDRIVLSASNDDNWHVNDGNVQVETYDTDLDHHGFSHARVYDVGAGSQNFYAVAQNYVETAGSGIGSIYGNLAVIVFPDVINAVWDSKELPMDFALHQNYPNPFNPSTAIKYSIAADIQVKIAVYDMLGKEVATLVNERKDIGTYEVTWDASGVPSGIYFCKIVADKFQKVQKMTLLK